METKIAGIKNHSSVDGPGIRCAIFFQGCTHQCHGCHNQDTWDINGGQNMDTNEIISLFIDDKFIDGITLTGGDPLLQSRAATIIASEAKKKNINVWCYTGYLYEDILQKKAGEDALELLKYVDTLVDGKFILAKKSSESIFRGSTNQRLINVQESLKQNSVIEQTSFDFGL